MFMKPFLGFRHSIGFVIRFVMMICTLFFMVALIRVCKLVVRSVKMDVVVRGLRERCMSRYLV